MGHGSKTGPGGTCYDLCGRLGVILCSGCNTWYCQQCFPGHIHGMSRSTVRIEPDRLSYEYRQSRGYIEATPAQPARLEPGQEIRWRRTPRGRGHIEVVIAYVVKLEKYRIGIAVLKADRRTWEPQWVKRKHVSRDVRIKW